MTGKSLFILPAAVLCLALAGLASFEIYRKASPREDVPVPTTTVKRGEVRFDVTARGELQGGNSEMLVAPMTGGREMVLTELRQPGDLVETGEVVARFDTTEQEFSLREAEADLDEAEQQLIQATAENEAAEEEARYALIHAKAEVTLAELEVRKNPLIAAIPARQNTLALEAARDQLHKLEQDVSSRAATSKAGIAIQEAARNKAKVKADTARRNIESMTLRVRSKGYVAIQNNTNTNMMYPGMELPMLQVGDTVRAGMAIAQIPDLTSWDASARIGELDRGHLALLQDAEISVIALPGNQFKGKVKNIGGTSGPPWDRRFECKIALVNPSADLRPGMSVNIVIHTGVTKDALWLPSQAVFESDGRAFVYLHNGAGFEPRDVQLVRRSESQVVLLGLKEGQTVALANPAEELKKKAPASGVMKALPKT